MSKGKESSAGSPEQRCVSNTPASGELNVANLQETEVEITKQVQRQAFPSEIRSLQIVLANAKNGSREVEKEKTAVLKKTSTLCTLHPFLDSDGVMRVGGRIRKATLSESLKNPVILPKSSHITALVISYAYERTHHSGRGITVNVRRVSGYWFVGGNSMVRQFISKCVTCRYLRGPVGEQKMAESRTEPAPPFTYCGVDFLGPWHVQRGRSVVKRYGALFTCFLLGLCT